MKEEDLQRTVLDMCKRLRLKVAHFPRALVEDEDGRGKRWRTPLAADAKGYPDLTIAGPGGVMWRELKAAGKYPTAEQRQWINALDDAGSDVRVWWPNDLRNGTIERELKRLARPRDGV